MDKHKFYYNREDKHIYRYFAHIGEQYFKTREEYDNYVKENNLPTESSYYFRLSKYALKNEECLLGKWIKYDGIIPGTVLHDDRDFSRYTFNSVEEVDEFLNYYDAQDFHYCQQCFYDGYEGDEVDSITYRANEIIKTFGEHVFVPEKENKKFAHFIISYLPNTERRATRREAHLKQIADIKEVTPNARIYIIAQGYKEEDYLKDPQITYLAKYDEPIGAQQARNELLKWFYGSDYEYGIFSDDDAFIVPTDTVKNFYEELENNTEKFTEKRLDVCYSRNMQYSPFNRGDVEGIEAHNKNYEFWYARSGWICWALFRNFKKAYDKEFYQDVTIDPTKTMGYDDTDFSCSLIEGGMHSYSCPLFQLLLLNSEEYSSTIFTEADNDPLYRVRNIKATNDKHMDRDENGYIDWEGFRVKWGNPRHIVLPREKEVDADKEITGRQTDIIKAIVRGEKAQIRDRASYYL